MSIKQYAYNLSGIGTIKIISPTIKDTVSPTGVHVKNIIDEIKLNGNDYTWALHADYVTWKVIKVNSFGIDGVADTQVGYKYDNQKLRTDVGTNFSPDIMGFASNILYISVADADTGWVDSWVAGTSFTNMAWGGLSKAYMNHWKLTTADTNVANCIWTGITSGVTKSGASGYTYVTTTIDTTTRYYKMIYQLTVPITTQLYIASKLSKSLKYVSIPYDNLFI